MDASPPPDRVVEEYKGRQVRLQLTETRLIAHAPSTRLLGSRSAQTVLFLDQLDSVEYDVEGHDSLAALAMAVFALSWLADGGRLPLLVITGALALAYAMTRRPSVAFRAGSARVAIETSRERDEALDRFVKAVQRAQRLSRSSPE